MQIEVRRHCEHNQWTYSMLDQRQKEIAAQVQSGGEGALLLSEVAPVITFGKRTKAAQENLLFSPSVYSKLGVDLYQTERGGFATYHGRGQWVLFAVDTLEALTGDSRGVKKAICGLLEIAQNVGRKYLTASKEDRVDMRRSTESRVEIRDGAQLGVWSKKGKLASVGIQIHDRILQHGLALNCFQTEKSFYGLRPCGLDPEIDYLLDCEDQKKFEEIGNRLIEETKRIFWRDSF